MDSRSLNFIAEGCGGELLRGAAGTAVVRVCTDSRQARAGDLFIALTGDKFDGHNFLDEVARKGVAAVMGERLRMTEGFGVGVAPSPRPSGFPSPPPASFPKGDERSALSGPPVGAREENLAGSAGTAGKNGGRLAGTLAPPAAGESHAMEAARQRGPTGGGGGERLAGSFRTGDLAPPAMESSNPQSEIGNPQSQVGVIAVDNTRQGLGRLAARYRADFDLPVIAVGGSNGKTSTKELVASVLRQKFKTLWSEASFNNDIGVPLTLLNLESTHQAAVLEVGTNHPGELAPLVRMIQPKIGVITSIGREHLEFFGDLAGVAQEEGVLAEMLPGGGLLLVNGDGEWAEPIARRSKARVLRVGLESRNDWRASNLCLEGLGTAKGGTPGLGDQLGMRFQVDGPKAGLRGEYWIGLLGRHQVVNAVFAVAVGAELGLSRGEIQRGLIECKPAKMRLQRWNWNGVCVLDDAYNANADSMKAALETLRLMPCMGRRVAVLGDMGELGEHSQSAHEEVGRVAAEAGVNRLFAVGKMAGVMAGAARTAGLRETSEFADPASAAEAVKRFLAPGDVMLLKASRATQMERLTEALKSQQAAG